jgi:cyclopropane fatty-acyl-phospholipid synthase-like methyltransferase
MSSYNFGKNWQDYLDRYFSPERIQIASESLTGFLKQDSFEGKTFLDIGCGSGLFSLCAFRLKAERVISVDINPESVACARQLWESEGKPDNWEVREASILDLDSMADIPKCDIVYSWGVLHHTGEMYQALENAVTFVAERGEFYLALYNTADSWALHPDGRVGPSSFWKKEKQFYVNAPGFVQKGIDSMAMLLSIGGYVVTLKNPVKAIRNHSQLRGMSWATDIRDWLGGWPYETATVDEIFEFGQKSGFELINVKSNNGLLNNEFVFKKK